MANNIALDNYSYRAQSGNPAGPFLAEFRGVSRFRPSARRWAACALVLALAALMSGFGGGPAWAQQTAVCSSEPEAGQRVDCQEHDNDNPIDLDLDGVTISTTGSDRAVYLWKGGSGGTGDISIRFANGSITTSSGVGIDATHDGAGGIRIEVLKSIFNTGTGGGIYGTGLGYVDITVRDSTITTTGAGVVGSILRNGNGDLDIDLRNTGIASRYQGIQAIHGELGQASTGNIDIRIEGGSITTTDGGSGHGVDASHFGTGDMYIWLSGTSITAPGSESPGIIALHYGSGDIEGFNGIKIDVLKSIFNTGGTGIHAEGNDPSSGSPHIVDANVAVHVRDSEITVTGDGSKGVFGLIEGAGDLDIDLRNTGIETSGMLGNGVQGYFENTGEGKLGIRIEGGSVTATGDGAQGVRAGHEGTGDIDIHIRGAEVSTSGNDLEQPSGVYNDPVAIWSGVANGNIRIHVVGGSTVSTLGGLFAHGILAWRPDGGGGEEIHILVQGSTVTTAGGVGYGITARDLSSSLPDENSHIRIDVQGSTITTTGNGARGIDARRFNGAGDIVIDVAGSTVSTSGGQYGSSDPVSPYGIYADHRGTAGDIFITVRDGSRVTTEGDDAYGIFGFRYLGGDSDVVIALRGGTVATLGAGAHGIIGRQHTSDGDVVIAVRDGGTVTTEGAGAHGIWAIGAGGGVHVLVRNAAVRATGAGSHGIRVQGGGLDADGNRMQTVSVGSEVWGGSGTGAGIWLIGGGRVIIGPDGRIGADTGGVAIRVTRVDPSDGTESPRLLLELRLDPRSLDPEKLLAGGIENQHGTTAYEVKVNGMTLFDSVDGATGVWTPIGAHDVRATGDDFASLAFARRFAPRAAVYEALPGVLLRIDGAGGPGSGETLLRSAGTPAYARIAVGQGSYEPGTATVAARYDYDRFGVESGMDFPLDYELTGLTGLSGWAGVRVVSGSAKVSSPAGGGRIEARGLGVIGGVAWEGDDGLYGRGRLSLTRYNADLSSETRGGLKSGASGWVHALGIEGGRRFDLDLLGRKTRLTARGALRRSSVSMGEFEDGLFSRVSITDADRLAAGAGVIAETGLLPLDGADRLRLRGSLDAEQVLSGGTKVDVSETALESEAGGTRLGAGLGAAYRMGGYTIGGSVGAAGLGSGDTSYSARLQARFAF